MFLFRFKKSNWRSGVLKFEEMSIYDLNDLQAKYETLANELQVCRCKLDSKCEALLILSKELDQCRSERDQFKLMAEQLRERYQAIKRQMTGRSPIGSCHDLLDVKMYKDMETESLLQLLCDVKEVNKSLKFEADDLKQKLNDAQGDIKLLREQIARQRVGTSDEGMTTRHFPAYERENLVKQLEASREQYLQLEHDLQQLLDEKEDQETELDAYKSKYENLNRELNYILKGDEKRIVDIDALVAENKYLTDRLKQMEEEKSMAMATASKYKSILERRKNKGILKFGQSRSGGLVITQKQVGQMLHNPTTMPSTPQAMADLQGLCGALLDTINDKNLALSHQRKTNKILGNRVSELEKKLKTLEVSGLWNVPDMTSLVKLRSECNEVKTLIPRHFSESSDTSVKTQEKLDDFHDFESELSSSVPSSVSSPVHVAQTVRFSSHTVDMNDLDLLPTKEFNSLSKSTNNSQITKENCLLQDNKSTNQYEEDKESDQLLAGFIIEKPGYKCKPQAHPWKGKHTKSEAQSLLDNQSQSESESSPEKQRHIDTSDYDDTADKMSSLLNDATTKLQIKSRNVEEMHDIYSNQLTQTVTRKNIPKCPLDININCDFKSPVDCVTGENSNTNNSVKGMKGDNSHDNLIDMNSPVHEKTSPISSNTYQTIIDNSACMVSSSQNKTAQSPAIFEMSGKSQAGSELYLTSVTTSVPTQGSKSTDDITESLTHSCHTISSTDSSIGLPIINIDGEMSIENNNLIEASTFSLENRPTEEIVSSQMNVNKYYNLVNDNSVDTTNIDSDKEIDQCETEVITVVCGTTGNPIDVSDGMEAILDTESTSSDKPGGEIDNDNTSLYEPIDNSTFNNDDMTSVQVSTKQNVYISDDLYSDHDNGEDEKENDEMECERSPSKQPLLFDKNEPSEISQYQPSQTAANLC